MVLVVGCLAADQDLIPDNAQLRQKSGVGQDIANSAIFYFFKTWNFNPSFNQTCLTASFHRIGVLAKAMQCDWSHLVNDVGFSIEKSYFSWIWVDIWQGIYFFSCWSINSESAKVQNVQQYVLIKELKSYKLSCCELSRKVHINVKLI